MKLSVESAVIKEPESTLSAKRNPANATSGLVEGEVTENMPLQDDVKIGSGKAPERSSTKTFPPLPKKTDISESTAKIATTATQADADLSVSSKRDLVSDLDSV